MGITIKNIFSILKDKPNEKKIYIKVNKRTAKNQRKNKNDRRDSVRNGIIVSLSGRKNRRIARDRRKNII